MKRFPIAILIILIVTIVSCNQKSGKEKYKLINPDLIEAELMEFEQTSSYSYVYLKQGKEKYWAAISRIEDLKPGSLYYFDDFMEMNEFHSKELDKTFDRIFFINKFSNRPFEKEESQMPQHNHGDENPVMNDTDKKGSTESPDMKVKSIEKAEGGYTINEIYAGKSEFAGKSIKVSGQVVKFTPGVMGKNWIHIQDGSGGEKVADLTVTTDLEVHVGDQVIVEGILAVDKDFGHGYSYDVLLEDAKVLNVKHVENI